jgi:hypothetical protein
MALSVMAIKAAKGRAKPYKLANSDGLYLLVTISAQELLVMLRKMESKGRYETAKRLRSTCSQIFRYAIATARAERDVAADLRGALIAPKAVHRAAIELQGSGRLGLSVVSDDVSMIVLRYTVTSQTGGMPSARGQPDAVLRKRRSQAALIWLTNRSASDRSCLKWCCS